MENGRCVGASVRQNGVTRAIRAQYVVLSDGGFQANADLLRRFISGAPERLLMRNAETGRRSEEHTSELQSLMRISYAVFCLKKKTTETNKIQTMTYIHTRIYHNIYNHKTKETRTKNTNNIN